MSTLSHMYSSKVKTKEKRYNGEMQTNGRCLQSKKSTEGERKDRQKDKRRTAGRRLRTRNNYSY